MQQETELGDINAANSPNRQAKTDAIDILNSKLSFWDIRPLTHQLNTDDQTNLILHELFPQSGGRCYVYQVLYIHTYRYKSINELPNEHTQFQTK